MRASRKAEASRLRAKQRWLLWTLLTSVAGVIAILIGVVTSFPPAERLLEDRLFSPFFVQVVALQYSHESRLTLVSDEPEGQECLPVDLAVYWTVNNTSSITRQIVSYNVALETSRRRRVRLRRVRATKPRQLLVYSSPSGKPKSTDISKQYFEEIVRAKSLGPHETAKGYAFFTFDTNNFYEKQIESLRVTINDSEGGVSTVSIRAKEHTDGLVPVSEHGFIREEVAQHPSYDLIVD